MSVALIALLGALINVAGTAAYIAETLRGRNKPNRMTFLMWSIAPIIGAAASFVQGVTWATVPVLAAGLCPFAVFLASFVNRNAYWKLGRFDYACGVLSALALVLWWFTNEPMIALVLAIFADAAAGYPTLIKSWKFPETETAIGYVASTVSVATSFLVLQGFNFESVAFPLYLIAMNTALVIGILRGKLRRSV